MKISEIIQKLLEQGISNRGLCLDLEKLSRDLSISCSRKIKILSDYILDNTLPYTYLQTTVLEKSENWDLYIAYIKGSTDTKQSIRHAIRLGFLIEAKKHFESIGD